MTTLLRSRLLASSLMQKLCRAGAIIARAAAAFVEDQALTHGAAVAFFTGLSLAPLLILLMWASSLLGPDVQDRLVDQVAMLTGHQGGTVVRMVVENADTDVDVAHLAGWLSLGALLLSATTVFGQLQVALNTVWGVQSKPMGLGIGAWLRKRLLSLGLIVSFGFLLLVSLVASSIIAAVTESVRGTSPGTEIAWGISNLVVPLCIYVVMFMALFRYLPDADLTWRHVWAGGIVTACLFALGQSLISLYLGTRALGSPYGAAGSLLAMLLWTYYSAAIVLFGAELTEAWVRSRGEHIRVSEHAVRRDGGQTPRAADRAPLGHEYPASQATRARSDEPASPDSRAESGAAPSDERAS